MTTTTNRATMKQVQTMTKQLTEMRKQGGHYGEGSECERLNDEIAALLRTLPQDGMAR